MKFQIVLLAVLLRPVAAMAALRVVATVPDLADMSRRIGGDNVRVDVLARGTEDIHQITMRPSFVTKLNRADAVVFLGLSVEHAFLPGLLDVARNPKMRADAVQDCSGPACIDCSPGVHVLELPQTLSRAQGELHPRGNPHYNLSPESGPIMARAIAAGFSRIDPAHAADYEKNLKAYLAELTPKIAEWRAQAAALKGLKAVSFHKDVVYLGAFTGIDFVDTVELKPGVAPTPSHLSALVEEMKAQKVSLIVREQQYDSKTTDWLAAQTGARVAVIGTMANALPDSDSYVKFCEANIRGLIKAAGKG